MKKDLKIIAQKEAEALGGDPKIFRYWDERERKHIYLMTTYLWNNLDSIEFDSGKVAWLLAVPISEQERIYATQNGIDALEDLFEQKDIDLYNIRRGSWV